MNWKRGLRRLFVVLASLWLVGCLLLAIGASTTGRSDAFQNVAGILAIGVVVPLVCWGILEALIWAIEGFIQKR